MQKFNLPIGEEMTTYLERLAYDVQTREGVVTRILTTAISDDVLLNPAYKHFMKDLQEAVTKYELAKKELTEQLKPAVEEKIGKDGEWSWNVPNFSKQEAVITVIRSTNAGTPACSCASNCCEAAGLAD